jgi:hypothetical protein
MKELAMRGVRSSASLFCSARVLDAIRVKGMPSIYLPRLAIAIIALLIFLLGLAIFLKGVLSEHFAIDMESFHLYLHL